MTCRASCGIYTIKLKAVRRTMLSGSTCSASRGLEQTRFESPGGQPMVLPDLPSREQCDGNQSTVAQSVSPQLLRYSCLVSHVANQIRMQMWLKNTLVKNKFSAGPPKLLCQGARRWWNCAPGPEQPSSKSMLCRSDTGFPVKLMQQVREQRK